MGTNNLIFLENLEWFDETGHQLLVFEQCARCSKNLTPTAKFCSRCAHPTEEKPVTRSCPNCGSDNLSDAFFCNECGEKLD